MKSLRTLLLLESKVFQVVNTICEKSDDNRNNTRVLQGLGISLFPIIFRTDHPDGTKPTYLQIIRLMWRFFIIWNNRSKHVLKLSTSNGFISSAFKRVTVIFQQPSPTIQNIHIARFNQIKFRSKFVRSLSHRFIFFDIVLFR